jgi:predicted subunit of tRNA(5-methylaminomethyl-2-thiouridylate) methyltransferase
MNIHEIQQILWVETELGYGIALFLMDYGLQNNTVWVVALKETGEIKHFDSNQIKLCRNHTIGLRTDTPV